MTDTDHVARLRAFADAWRDSDMKNREHSPSTDGRRYFGDSWFQVPGTDTKLTESQLRAALDELERLRAQQRPALGNAYAAGFTDAIGAVRTPGWAEREAGWKRFLGEVDADPEAYAKAKFAADMDRLRKTDPGGAQWVEHILAERVEQKPALLDRGGDMDGAP